MVMENYRKATKGEVTCEQCRNSRRRMYTGRYECLLAIGRPAVGRNNRCDSAALPRVR